MAGSFGRAGVSRRQLIARAVAAGTTAWVAPVILDSVGSAALATAGSPGPCTKYWVKVSSSGACSPYCPGSGGGVSFPVADALWAGSCAHPSGCDAGDGAAHMPVVSTVGNYYEVTLPSGCWFSSTTDWQIGGRYETASGQCPGDVYLKVAGATCSGVPSSGNGCFVNGGNQAWILKRYPSTSRDLCYIYLKFCCAS